jgi:RNA methyltransferase, TrmH family
MLSKNKIKLIASLALKKHRTEAGLFVVEGEKMVAEMIQSKFPITYLAGTDDWFQKYPPEKLPKNTEHDIVTPTELNKVSFQKTPQSVLCVAKLPNYTLHTGELAGNLSFLLDTIQDPGNLGTILRIADWFGIEHIICSRETVDAYSPKVVQATMGAIGRVKIYYEDFSTLLPQLKSLGMPIYGTTLGGENIYQASLANDGFIMMGNESKGINPAWQQMLDQQLFIPFFPENNQRSESLNVAVAAAIVCSEFRRRTS